MSIKYRSKAMIVEAVVSTEEAIAVISKLPGNFPQSLVFQYEAKKGKGESLSESQLAWVHKLANEKIQQQQAQAPSLSQAFSPEQVEKVFGMFKKAGSSLKYPKLNIHFGGVQFTVYVAGSKSKYQGQLQLKDGENYLGRVDLQGVLHPAKGMSEAHKMSIEIFLRKPEEVMIASGRLSGACCVCSRALTDSRSVEAGIGPVCADRFGIAWGKSLVEAVL